VSKYLPVDVFSASKVQEIMIYDKLKSFLSLEDRENTCTLPLAFKVFQPSFSQQTHIL